MQPQQIASSTVPDHLIRKTINYLTDIGTGNVPAGVVIEIVGNLQACLSASETIRRQLLQQQQQRTGPRALPSAPAADDKTEEPGEEKGL